MVIKPIRKNICNKLKKVWISFFYNGVIRTFYISEMTVLGFIYTKLNSEEELIAADITIISVILVAYALFVFITKKCVQSKTKEDFYNKTHIERIGNLW
jgi:hypothetical protein